MSKDSDFELIEATIDSIHEAMRTGQITCRQLVQAYLDRIEAYDQKGPALNSIQNRNPRALEHADRVDAEVKSGGIRGPLHGIPVVVKDQVETDDMPTTYGSALFRNFVPQRNATIVERMRAAGAIILAKTTMGEFAAAFAGSSFGACRNAYDPTRDPSGSSSGTGASLAANFATVGIGEDTLGSIRGPAARGSLVGLRPTLPLVSRFGMMPATPTRDTLGPLARTVRDTVLLLDVIAGYDPNDPITASSVGHVPPSYTAFLDADGLRGKRIGVIREAMSGDADTSASDFKEVRSIIDRALREMEARGAEIVDVEIAGLRDLIDGAGGAYESEECTDAYLAQHPHAPVKTLQEIVLSSEVLPYRRVRLMEGIGHTTHDVGYLNQLQVREQLRQATYTAMADNRVDVLAYSTFDHDPRPIPDDVLTRMKQVTQPGNNRHLSPLIVFPAISVPAGYTAGGLPVGLELLGRPFTESMLFTIAYAFEQATHHRRPPSTTPALAGGI